MKRDFIPGWLRSFARQQPLYLITASWVAALWWAITGSAPSLEVTLVYSFALGNLAALTLENVPFPRRLISCGSRAVFGGMVLLLTTPVIVAVSTLIVFYIALDPAQDNFWRYLASGYKFPAVATIIFGCGYLMYKLNRDRMEQTNRELQQTITLDRAQRNSEAAELQQAREIQQNLLPKSIPQVPGFQIAGTWEPARVVGGDYYDVLPLGDQKLGLCIADVSGKGISAALLMANVQAAVRAFATESASPAEVCERLNSVLCTNTASDKFVTLFYGVLDAKNATLTFTNAGHLQPIVVNHEGEIARPENGGALLGFFPDWKYGISTVQLAAGDILILFTDGITEAEADNGEEFGEDRLIETLITFRHLSSEKLQSQLLAQVKKFCSRALADDATLIIVSANSFVTEPIQEGLGHNQFSYSGVTK